MARISKKRLTKPLCFCIVFRYAAQWGHKFESHRNWRVMIRRT